VINPTVKEKQLQQDSYWDKRLAASGTLKAEASGKIVVLTDLILGETVGTDPIVLYIKKGTSGGTNIIGIPILAGDNFAHVFRQGLEGNAYDGSNAGDLYIGVTGSGTATIFASGYMRDA